MNSKNDNIIVRFFNRLEEDTTILEEKTEEFKNEMKLQHIEYCKKILDKYNIEYKYLSDNEIIVKTKEYLSF